MSQAQLEKEDFEIVVILEGMVEATGEEWLHCDAAKVKSKHQTFPLSMLVFFNNNIRRHAIIKK